MFRTFEIEFESIRKKFFFDSAMREELHVCRFYRGKKCGRRSHINWTVGDALPTSESGSLRHFLTERYYLYAGRGDRLWRGAVWHEPWSLRQVEVHELQDDLVAHAGIETDDSPSFMALKVCLLQPSGYFFAHFTMPSTALLDIE